MRVLYLPIKKKWFSMILCGDKKEEYREIKPYWNKRLLNKEYDFIEFRNGYGKNAPSFRIGIKGLYTGYGIVEWGATERERVYILSLTDKVSRLNRV